MAEFPAEKAQEPAEYLAGLLGFSVPPPQLVHTRVIQAREPQIVPWPESVSAGTVRAFAQLGISAPFSHQAQAVEAVLAGEHTVVATGTASGKSLAYQSAFSTVSEQSPKARALYLAPTKALGADQLLSWQALRESGASWIRPGLYDGDTSVEERRWAREYATVLLTNPDMLHVGILPHHDRWAQFFRNLKLVIIDEAHSYRGVFGSHVAVVMRRLQRICAHYRNHDVVFIGASATSADPAKSFSELVGAPAKAVTEDGSGHGAVTVGFWESEFSDQSADHGAPIRRSLISTGADMLADLVSRKVRSIAFIRSRRGAEAMAQSAKRQVADVASELVGKVAVYRAGLLPEERREVEQALDTGDLLAVATTPALELGIDIAGLDAVIVTGWPGTRASFFQQLGRAGRSGQDSIALYVAGDDPMDTYLVHHPDQIFEIAVEDSVIDPRNRHILGPHLCAAAAELALIPRDFERFGPAEEIEQLVGELTEAGYIRRRPAGWFWTHTTHAAGMISLRDTTGGPLNIVEAETGTVLGTMSSDQSHHQAHPGAIYTHQGRTWLVEDLDEESSTVVVSRFEPTFYTQSRDITDVEILQVDEELRSDEHRLSWAQGPVMVTTQVVSFMRRELMSNRVMGEEPLDLPARQLHTHAVWFHCPSEDLVAAGITMDRLPGSLHAAEHAMIGMLPLVASNDRWDIGGVSMALHPDTGEPTVFVYDGHPGGVGFSAQGFTHGATWVAATIEAIENCECAEGCPSCVQSPKCGNRNSPLDKAGAVVVLKYLLDAIAHGVEVPPEILHAE